MHITKIKKIKLLFLSKFINICWCHAQQYFGVFMPHSVLKWTRG